MLRVGLVAGEQCLAEVPQGLQLRGAERPGHRAGDGVHHTAAGKRASTPGSLSVYGEVPDRLSPRFGFGRGWRGSASPYLALTSEACVGASGTPGLRRDSSSLRSTGTTSVPSSS